MVKTCFSPHRNLVAFFDVFGARGPWPSPNLAARRCRPSCNGPASFLAWRREVEVFLLGICAWKIHGRPSSVWWKACLENDKHHRKTMGKPLNNGRLASGKRSHMTMVYIKQHMFMGKLTISMAFMAMLVYQRVHGLPSSKLRVR